MSDVKLCKCNLSRFKLDFLNYYFKSKPVIKHIYPNTHVNRQAHIIPKVDILSNDILIN